MPVRQYGQKGWCQFGGTWSHDGMIDRLGQTVTCMVENACQGSQLGVEGGGGGGGGGGGVRALVR